MRNLASTSALPPGQEDDMEHLLLVVQGLAAPARCMRAHATTSPVLPQLDAHRTLLLI